MKLSIIVPVYNEEKTIGKVLSRLEKVNLGRDIKKEIIIVDDGSTDNSVKIVSSLIRNKSAIKLVKHRKNQGKGAAVETGLKQARGDYILIQDADLEYNPEDIPRLLKPILEKRAGVVYGTRLKRLPNLRKDERRPRFLLHYLGNRFLSLITSLFYRQWITDMETGYKLFPRAATEEFDLKAKGFELEPEITAKLLKKGCQILEVPIITNPRGYEEGKKLNTFRDGLIAFWTLFKYRFIEK